MAQSKATVAKNIRDDEGVVYFPLSPPPPARAAPGARTSVGAAAPTNAVTAADTLVLPMPSRHSFASSGLLPDLSLYQQPRQTPSRTVDQSSGSRPPSVYWSDDASNAETSTIRSFRSIASWGTLKGIRAFKRSSVNPAAFTFYRESTPPPQEADEHGCEDDGDDTNNHAKTDQNRETVWMQGEVGVASGSGSGGGLATNDPKHKDRRVTADFEFVNGRYVPPGLRNGRKPGRIPPGSMAALNGFEKDICPTPVPTFRRDEQSTSDGASSYLRRQRWRRWCAVMSVLLVMVLIGVGVGVGVGLTVGKRGPEGPQA